MQPEEATDLKTIAGPEVKSPWLLSAQAATLKFIVFPGDAWAAFEGYPYHVPSSALSTHVTHRFYILAPPTTFTCKSWVILYSALKHSEQS